MTLTLALSPVDSFARAFLRLLAPFERPDGRAVRRIEFARSKCNGFEAYDVVPSLSWSRADDGTPTVTEVEIAAVRFDNPPQNIVIFSPRFSQ
ncbi:hypothetical protein [Haladaptatus sp. T7]|uniref:hypothetical protein n=1 Tax=Haladaptatus sp. T7 TaxID=2029368 RepID=UPI0021A25483|nr:hypothetical protein [Haladaptatus sp. T7]GKZ14342.1 hypothetical protein HAL_22230 [Haladaptatus sp. T7]